MLQHNIAARAGRRAHIAHGAVLTLHALCCGLPILALLAASLSGAASGAALFVGGAAELHALMHVYEAWILGGSAALVTLGGALELAARRQAPRRAFPWLFVFSAACFALNAAIVLVHRGV